MNEFKINPIEKNGQRVLTTAQLAEAYGTTEKRISENFNRNRKHFIEGKHFYCLTGDELKAFLQSANCGMQNLRKIRTLYLWTERGALLHAKSLNTEKAWEVYEFLVDNYFRTREMITSNNDLSVQVFGKLELLEQKIDKLESKSDNIIKTLFDMSDNVIATGFKFIYDHFFK